MIEISILELLYLVLTFFLIIIGTLLTLVLLRTLKILRVGVELTDYYNSMKKLFVYYASASFIMKDKIFEYFTKEQSQQKSESQNPTEK